MWELAGEIVSLAGPEYTGGAADHELDSAANDDAAFFTAVGEHLLAGRGSGGVTLVKDRELARRPVRRHEA